MDAAPGYSTWDKRWQPWQEVGSRSIARRLLAMTSLVLHAREETCLLEMRRFFNSFYAGQLYWFPCFWQPYMKAVCAILGFAGFGHLGAFGAIVSLLHFLPNLDNKSMHRLVLITLIRLAPKKTPILIVEFAKERRGCRYALFRLRWKRALETSPDYSWLSMALLSLSAFLWDFQWKLVAVAATARLVSTVDPSGCLRRPSWRIFFVPVLYVVITKNPAPTAKRH